MTPTITSDRNVLMDLSISSDQFTQPQAANVQTQTTRRTTSNSVLVPDGQTVVIGGLIQEENQENTQGVPFLKDVPVVGNLFSSSSQATDKRELIVFLTPHVIESAAESKRTTQRVSDDLQQITPLSINLNLASQAKISKIQGLTPDEDRPRRREELARQIVLYRETFGPFRSYSELLRVQGMTENIVNTIVYRTELDVDINTVSIDDLSRIKNINFEAARAVINTRQKRKSFQSLEPVRRILLDHGVSANYYQDFLAPIFYVAGSASTGNRQPSSATRSQYQGSGRQKRGKRKTGDNGTPPLRGPSSTSKETLPSIGGESQGGTTAEKSTAAGTSPTTDEQAQETAETEQQEESKSKSKSQTKTNLNKMTQNELMKMTSTRIAKAIKKSIRENGYFYNWNELKQRIEINQQQINQLKQKTEITIPVLNVNKSSA
ncbi:MAG: helix-hairpin-helix domain-containing protein, partial [bacterium]